MYNEDLLVLNKLQTTKTDSWTKKQMYKDKRATLLTTKERGVTRRARDFERIYDLHFVDGLAFIQIYKGYGLSPTYCK